MGGVRIGRARGGPANHGPDCGPAPNPLLGHQARGDERVTGNQCLYGAYVVTDARDQHLANPAALLPPGGAEAIIPLGQIANNEVRPRTDGRRVYLSRGLAGTEVALLTALADAVDG